MNARTSRVWQSLAKRIALAVGVVVILGGVIPVWLAEPAPAGADTLQPAGGLGARVTTRDSEQWARTAIPGIHAVHLNGLPPEIARILVENAARVAQRYDVLVPVIVPAGAWEAATDSAPLGAVMFASPQGIAFDPVQLVSDFQSGQIDAQRLAGFVVHEMGHVMAGGHDGADPMTADLQVRRIVTDYRRRVGKQHIEAELGGYAWRGGAQQPDRAWAETWAEAFRAYDADPNALTPETRAMVRQVLHELGYTAD